MSGTDDARSWAEAGPVAARLVNLTPHDIDLVVPDGRVRIPPTSPPARLEGGTIRVGTIRVGGVDVPLVQHRYERVTGLPEPEPGVLLIVAQIVLDHLRHRSDLVTPTDLVRDAEGRVIGCRALAGGGAQEG